MALLCFVVAFVDGPTLNPVVPLAGIAVASTGTLLYFLSPSRYLRDDVSDAVALSTVKTIGMALSSAPPGVRGTYLPAAQNGALQLFMPVSDDRRDVTTTRMGKGILLDPPGYDLLSYSRRIGASFSPEVLESSISDVMENGLELAGKVTVDREGDRVRVTMRDLANAGMCGETIISILRRAPCTKDNVTLFLQPQSKLSELCVWLAENHYALCGAVLVEDAGRLYAVLSVQGAAEPQGKLFVEDMLLRDRDPLLPRWLDEHISSLAKAAAGLSQAKEKTGADGVRETLERFIRAREETKVWRQSEK
jgi:tRNA A22 N-methylase